jgi:hypothetical protein
MALLLEGYAFEYEAGTLQFVGLLLGIHVASAALLTYFQFTSCCISVEPALVGMAVVMHRANPKVHADNLDKSIAVPFAIEPRWHLWVVLSLLLLTSGYFPGALCVYATGLLVGAVCALRDPDAWFDGWTAWRRRSPKIGYVLHVALLIFAITFMPLTAQEVPSDLIEAVLDGRALSLSWWRVGLTPSMPLLHMALIGTVAPEALFLCKLLLAFAVPLLASPYSMWCRFYAVACVILAMYSMTAPDWKFPSPWLCHLAVPRLGILEVAEHEARETALTSTRFT